MFWVSESKPRRISDKQPLELFEIRRLFVLMSEKQRLEISKYNLSKYSATQTTFLGVRARVKSHSPSYRRIQVSGACPANRALENCGSKNGGDGGFGTSGLGDDDSPAESANEARSLANSWQAASERSDLSSGLQEGRVTVLGIIMIRSLMMLSRSLKIL
jgi:hypothetical protein